MDSSQRRHSKCCNQLPPHALKCCRNEYMEILSKWYLVQVISRPSDILSKWSLVRVISCVSDISCKWYLVQVISCASDILNSGGMTHTDSQPVLVVLVHPHNSWLLLPTLDYAICTSHCWTVCISSICITFIWPQKYLHSLPGVNLVKLALPTSKIRGLLIVMRCLSIWTSL